MTHGILHATSKDTPVVKYTYLNGELIQEDVVKHEDLSDEVQEVRTILYNENYSRFKEKEREGHVEDLLIATILDPRFKLMNFIGCTSTKEKMQKSICDRLIKPTGARRPLHWH